MSTTVADANTGTEPTTLAPDPDLLRKMKNRWGQRALFLAKLPLAFLAGLRIDECDGHECAVSLPYGWRTQNPFRSIYFAALAMAAELSSGALGLLAVQSSKRSVAQLITRIEGDFIKKADARTTFRCKDGDKIFAAVAHTIETGEAVTVDSTTEGTLPDGTVVARFQVSWSFKLRSKPRKNF